MISGSSEIFARESIKAGTELTFDYQLDSLGNEKKKFFCGSKNCSRFLGLRSSKVNSEEEVKPKPNQTWWVPAQRDFNPYPLETWRAGAMKPRENGWR